MTKEELSKLIKESAEKKPIDDISSYNQGFVDGAEFALDKIRGIVDKEPGKESITLHELADWLHQGIIFDFLTVHYEDGDYIVCLWRSVYVLGAPAFANGIWWHCDKAICVIEITDSWLVPSLDLSEYQDENGEIDYGKCIIKCR